MMLVGVTTLVLVMAASTQAAPAVPSDGRLAPVRDQLQTLVQRADRAGLPSEMIVSKIREGLAKGVDAARIEAAAVRLAQNLEAAQRFLVERRAERPDAAMVRAVAEARQAGVPMNDLDGLARGDHPERRRAVEVLTDLSLRGYPAERAAAIVSGLLARDARSLERVPSTLETIRHDYALSPAEAVDALARGLASSDSLQSAYGRAVDDERKHGKGPVAPSRAGGDSERERSGRSDTPPGQFKKQGRSSGSSGKNH